jgi:ComF family protein
MINNSSFAVNFKTEIFELIRSFLNLIFPTVCLACGEILPNYDEELYGLPVCSPCKSRVNLLKGPCCSLCSTPFKSPVAISHLCPRCEERRPYFDRLLAPFLYEGILRDVVARFKYGRTGKEGKALGQVMGRFLKESYLQREGALMVPIPLHPRREMERGFNQTSILAKGIRDCLPVTMAEGVLVRTVDTKSQTGMGQREREANVRGAFEVRYKVRVKGKEVILVDDVATTGSTLNEASRVLKRAGAKRVICLVLARTRGELVHVF